MGCALVHACKTYQKLKNKKQLVILPDDLLQLYNAWVVELAK